MKILFVYPECENLGIEYLSANLKKAGHAVDLAFDPMLFNTYFLNIKILSKIFNFKSRILRQIKDKQPDLVCFSVFSDFYGWACELAFEIKKNNNNLPIIFGGIHPTSAPEEVIKNSFVDFVCVGEGEDALLELADALEKGECLHNISNIWSKKDGEIIKNETRVLDQNLDSMVFPDKTLFNKEFSNFSKGVYTIITGRGCINACTYCYNSCFKEVYKNKGKYLRRRSPSNVIEELKKAKKEFNFKRVSFFDDLFIYDIDWLREFTKMYKQQIMLPYFCHVHASFINKEVIDLLEGSGCSSVTMGIQTFDEHIRSEYLDRFESNESIFKAITAFKKSKIFLFTNIILGLPGQDEKVMIDDVRKSNIYKSDMPASNWLRYYPNVKLIKIAKKMDLLTEDDLQNIKSSRDYLPYSIKGNTYNPIGAKLRNLLSISHILPQGLMDWILKHRIYRFMPTMNMRFMITIFVFFHRKLILKKRNPFAYMNLQEVMEYYGYYIKKYLSGRLI